MDPWYLGAREIATLIRDRKVSAAEMLESYLGRVERYNPTVNAIVLTDPEGARAAARKADADLAAGRATGPLHGVPVTIKESFDLASRPSTFGRPERKDHAAPTDALVVERLKAAGAVFFGKTNVPRDLADWQSFNAVYGDTVNPWNAARTPGGSSGGAAAALAAGLTGLEYGSDIGGSIRIPAHCCGVYGHKPTYGIVPMRGHAFAPDDAVADILVAGPLARTAGDLALALDLTVGAEPGSAWRLDLPPEPRPAPRGWRIGMIADDPLYPVDRDTQNALRDVARHLAAEGAEIVEDPPLPLPSGGMWELYLTLLRGATSGRMTDDEARKTADDATAADPKDMSYGPVMLRGLSQSHHRWLNANDRRAWLRNRWREFFSSFDLLITPIMATSAFPQIRNIAKADQRLDVDGTARPIADTYFWLGLASATGLPATMAPAGQDRNGLPIGVQIIGPEFGDRRCLALAAALERGFRAFRPPPGFP